MRVDIFCRVIDNYGDAGVAWRLARALAAGHGATVTLRLDAIPRLAHIVPGLARDARDARIDGVRILALDDAAAAPAHLPDALIEAFGCGLPAPWLTAMVQAARQPVWVNLEYLSAEPWVENVHGLASPQPRLPLTRYFYFPGFTSRTGGLLREHAVLARRDAARALPRRARLPPALRPAVDAALDQAGAEALLVSLFCYAHAPLVPLLEAWTTGREAIACVVPEGVATAALAEWAGGSAPACGTTATRGALSVAVVPLVAQDDYDRLLWTCDVNFVRGEDSFVRAQWAGAPFVWQAYPQAGDAHRVKAEAFLARYLAGAPAGMRSGVTALWDAWNVGTIHAERIAERLAADGAPSDPPAGTDPSGAAHAWPAFRAGADAIVRHNAGWTARLAALPELAESLLEFMQNRL